MCLKKAAVPCVMPKCIKHLQYNVRWLYTKKNSHIIFHDKHQVKSNVNPHLKFIMYKTNLPHNFLCGVQLCFMGSHNLNLSLNHILTHLIFTNSRKRKTEKKKKRDNDFKWVKKKWFLLFSHMKSPRNMSPVTSWCEEKTQMPPFTTVFPYALSQIRVSKHFISLFYLTKL